MCNLWRKYEKVFIFGRRERTKARKYFLVKKENNQFLDRKCTFCYWISNFILFMWTELWFSFMIRLLAPCCVRGLPTFCPSFPSQVKDSQRWRADLLSLEIWNPVSNRASRLFSAAVGLYWVTPMWSRALSLTATRLRWEEAAKLLFLSCALVSLLWFLWNSADCRVLLSEKEGERKWERGEKFIPLNLLLYFYFFGIWTLIVLRTSFWCSGIISDWLGR